MQTRFSPARLEAPGIREADGILRSCVHCGFCTATCPTYVLRGDELDSPRGRIYLIKDMLEAGGAPDKRIVRHVDRCLSCLGCMTTCPSGVHYMHLVDLARRHIEENFRRPTGERVLRRLLAWVLPSPRRFALALAAARFAGLLGPALPRRWRAMLALVPRHRAPRADMRPAVIPAEGRRRRRVALLTGCVQCAMRPQINQATIRLLTRHGCEVVVAAGAGCCGALALHLGMAPLARRQAAANIDAWRRVAADGGLDAVVINASGCGTMVKDYGHLLRDDAGQAGAAAEIAASARDIAELVTEIGLDAPVRAAKDLVVAYHAPCSLRHGQLVVTEPMRLLAEAGFVVREPPESHLCCGSAGTYNILQPELAGQLRARKMANIAGTAADIVATGNIGCLMQIGGPGAPPVVHTVELLDWATGGPMPAELAQPGGRA
jgi:glycolate dehydrogenase iron-sulfur subunit